MNIKENLFNVRHSIPSHVTLVAVSKTHPTTEIMELYNAGQRVFGENKAQELINKQALLPQDIEWHFIGHLQTNKVRQIIPFVDTIESIDSLKLLRVVDAEAKKHQRKVRVLLQFYIASEETKFGLDLEEALLLLNSWKDENMQNTIIAGVMGMASFTEDHELIRKEFRVLKDYFSMIKKTFFHSDDQFKEISMGMSSDFEMAIEEGSTMVRVGTGIFGERDYSRAPE
ncbi:MAG: YggS family pyridoxal phosphate-dependent enzyme [Bacteroidota bacterium]